jgi:hypothetical protein
MGVSKTQVKNYKNNIESDKSKQKSLEQELSVLEGLDLDEYSRVYDFAQAYLANDYMWVERFDDEGYRTYTYIEYLKPPYVIEARIHDLKQKIQGIQSRIEKKRIKLREYEKELKDKKKDEIDEVAKMAGISVEDTRKVLAVLNKKSKR